MTRFNACSNEQDSGDLPPEPGDDDDLQVIDDRLEKRRETPGAIGEAVMAAANRTLGESWIGRFRLAANAIGSDKRDFALTEVLPCSRPALTSA